MNKHEKKKLLLLCAAACSIAAAYAILRPFKISLFFQLVGKEYYPVSKLLMVFVAIPAVAWYSKLVDFFRRHTILYILFSSYFFIGLLLAYFLAHPAIGLSNTVTGPFRLLGWLYTAAMDFYPTFVIGTFWAFINSTSTPTFAKNSYAYIYTGVKVGSIAATAISFFVLRYVMRNNTGIPLLIVLGSSLTLLGIFFIAKIVRDVPEEQLGGYSGKNPSIQFHSVKSLGANGKQKGRASKGAFGMIEGLTFILTKPYVFGIFVLFYCYEVIYTIVEYQATILLCQKTSVGVPAGQSCAAMSSYLFLSATISQIIGLVVTLALTRWLLRTIKLSYILMIMPAFVAGMILLVVAHPSLFTIVAVMSMLPAVHFSLNSPAREILFIPTVKNIQFKSKAWIDSFGRTLSKSSGSTLNLFFAQMSQTTSLGCNAAISLVICVVWTVVAHAMGRSYDQTIEEKATVGEKS